MMALTSLLLITLVPAASAFLVYESGVGLTNAGATPSFAVVVSGNNRPSRAAPLRAQASDDDAPSMKKSLKELPRRTNDKMLPRRFLQPVSVNIDDLLGKDGKFRSDLGPRVAGPDSKLPDSMKGIFWLSDQGQGSSIMSFAKSQDGGGVGTGELQEGKDSIKIRASGDRSWSLSDKAAAYHFVEKVDLVYYFQADSITDPEFFKLFSHMYKNGKEDNIPEPLARYVLSFDMSKMTPEQTKEKGYAGSQLWYRPSYSQAFADGGLISEYYVVQIVDANSNPIQPAYDKWVEYSKSPEAGETPGVIHYWEAMPLAKRT